jgi:hypothetical protein
MNVKKGMSGKKAAGFKSSFSEFNCGLRSLIEQSFGEVVIVD